MKNIVIIPIVLLFMSCATNKSFVEECWSSQTAGTLGPNQIIYFQDDSTYIKANSVSFGIYWEGKWKINGDTLILEDMYDVINAKQELVSEGWHAKNTKYIRQGKVWCYIDDTNKPKKKRDVLRKNNHIKKEDVLNWPFRYD